VLYTAAGKNGPTWSLWQKAPGETWDRPLGFGIRDTDHPRPPILPLKKRFWQYMKAFELLQKWSALKHSSS